MTFFLNLHTVHYKPKHAINLVITMICKCALLLMEGWRGWLGREQIRMATQVAQLLLKGLFITVRSCLASSPLFSPSSILTRPHLNNGPNTKKRVTCVLCVRAYVGGFQIPLIFCSASLSIKAAITT